MNQRHIFLVTLHFGERNPEDDVTDAQYRDMSSVLEGLRGALRMHAAEISQTLGHEIVGSFTAAPAVMPAVRACRTWLAASPVAARNDARLKVAVHYGEVVVNRSEIFGDNMSLTFRLSTRSPRQGVYFTAPAADALPAADRAGLKVRAMPHGALKPRMLELLGRPEVYEL